MATSTNIQYLNSSGISELGATVQVGASTSNRRQVETFISGGVIAAGDWVAFDTSATGATKMLTVTTAALTALGNALIVGVALEAATAAGQQVEVVVSGFAGTAAVANAVVAAGVPLGVVAGTAGRATAVVAADIANACGVSLTAAVGNVAEVFVYKNF